jgi:hypothetical protein
MARRLPHRLYHQCEAHKEQAMAVEQRGRLMLALFVVVLFIMDVVLAYLYVNASLTPPI